jgi:hypothetical protein
MLIPRARRVACGSDFTVNIVTSLLMRSRAQYLLALVVLEGC